MNDYLNDRKREEWLVVGTLIVSLFLAAMFALAVRSMYKQKKSGGCCGCSGCSGSCGTNGACSCASMSQAPNTK